MPEWMSDSFIRKGFGLNWILGIWGCKESDTTEQLNWTEAFKAMNFPQSTSLAAFRMLWHVYLCLPICIYAYLCMRTCAAACVRVCTSAAVRSCLCISLLEATVTKCYKLGSLHDRNLFSHSSVPGLSQSGKPLGFLGLWKHHLGLCLHLHMTFSQVPLSVLYQRMQISPLSKDIIILD